MKLNVFGFVKIWLAYLCFCYIVFDFLSVKMMCLDTGTDGADGSLEDHLG